MHSGTVSEDPRQKLHQWKVSEGSVGPGLFQRFGRCVLLGRARPPFRAKDSSHGLALEAAKKKGRLKNWRDSGWPQRGQNAALEDVLGRARHTLESRKFPGRGWQKNPSGVGVTLLDRLMNLVGRVGGWPRNQLAAVFPTAPRIPGLFRPSLSA